MEKLALKSKKELVQARAKKLELLLQTRLLEQLPDRGRRIHESIAAIEKELQLREEKDLCDSMEEVRVSEDVKELKRIEEFNANRENRAPKLISLNESTMLEKLQVREVTKESHKQNHVENFDDDEDFENDVLEDMNDFVQEEDDFKNNEFEYDPQEGTEEEVEEFE